MNLPPIQIKDFFGKFAAQETEEQIEGAKTDVFNGLLAEIFTAVLEQKKDKPLQPEDKGASYRWMKELPEKAIETTDLTAVFAEVMQKTEFQEFSKGTMQPVQIEKVELRKTGQTMMDLVGGKNELAEKTAMQENVSDQLPTSEKRMTKITESEVKTDRLFMKQPEEKAILLKNEVEAIPIKQVESSIRVSQPEVTKMNLAEPKTLAETKSYLEKHLIELEKMQVGREQLFIRLKPAHLGQIELVLKKSADQLIIRAEYTESSAKEKVTQVMQNLRAQYKEKGMDIQFVTAERVSPPPASKEEASMATQGNQKRETDSERQQRGGEQQEKRERREQAERIESDEEEQQWIFPL
ncbi:flagellar hook-length control protein FliK [Listeria ilorinensis]|uniref:flagellar hook-length control protein FliK n=1 Tax=Listeria ilorinensis TaxID=2867439 RepID=UPI001EF540B2|nr:flagellar hook-length control protein FliK [Listeria ilorinensis]